MRVATVVLQRGTAVLLFTSPFAHCAYTGDMEMLDSEFDKWHMKQMKREDALKKVEDKVKLKFSSCT